MRSEKIGARYRPRQPAKVLSPTTTGFYVLPWAGVALPFHTVGDATLGAMTYESKLPVFPLAAVHLGWKFGH